MLLGEAFIGIVGSNSTSYRISLVHTLLNVIIPLDLSKPSGQKDMAMKIM